MFCELFSFFILNDRRTSAKSSHSVVQVGGISPASRYAFRLDEQLQDISSISIFSNEGDNIVSKHSSPNSLVQAAKTLLEQVRSDVRMVC
jgi:hypothetical protein